MQIRQIIDNNFRDDWNDFVIANSSPASFLQSWEWGEFKIKTQNLNNKNQNNLFRFGIFEDNNLIAVAQFFKTALRFGKFYLNCAKGPIIQQSVISNQQSEVFKLLNNKIKNISKQEKLVFFRIAPPYKKDHRLLITDYGLPKILTHLKEPENSLILDLSVSEENILKNMHQKTRYNIRLAEKKGIKIKEYGISNNELNKNIDIFYNLLKQTAKRDKINIFGKSYYESLLNFFNKSLITHYSLLITLFIAKYKNQPLSSIIVIGFGDTATYFYGASSDKKRNLMPNYLIQWEAIKWAKKNNYKYYDFWGVNENNWIGITRFKKGFGGQEINYAGNFDYILNKKWYNIFRIGKLLNKIQTHIKFKRT